MALQDQIIQRLRDHGLEVEDLRGILPRNGRWLGRPVSAIKQIAGHWDAEPRPHAYDSAARYVGQALYHINKDWAPPGGVHGDGLMYAWKIDNTGVVFITRDLEDVLWSVGDQNYVTASYCFDGTTGQGCTREQIVAEQKLLDVLCFECPEFPASQANVLGHQEVPGNSTSCPGDFLPSIRAYRAERNTHAERYEYELAPAPTPSAPKPPVVAPPVPAPVAENPAPVHLDVPAPPVPGTIIQPEPGKGGGQPVTPTASTGQANGSLPVSTPPVATPSANATDLTGVPVPSFAFPAPAISHDKWEPFAEGERVVFLDDAALAIDLTGQRPAFEVAADKPVRAVGFITIGDKRYLIGKSNFGIKVAPEEVASVPKVRDVSWIGELLRGLGSVARAVLAVFRLNNQKE